MAREKQEKIRIIEERIAELEQKIRAPKKTPDFQKTIPKYLKRPSVFWGIGLLFVFILIIAIINTGTEGKVATKNKNQVAEMDLESIDVKKIEDDLAKNSDVGVWKTQYLTNIRGENVPFVSVKKRPDGTFDRLYFNYESEYVSWSHENTPKSKTFTIYDDGKTHKLKNDTNQMGYDEDEQYLEEFLSHQGVLPGPDDF
jgi:hypothetical protein